MIDALNELKALDWKMVLYGLGGLIIILVAMKFVWELIEWFLKKFKIETGSMREKRETRELLEQNSQSLNKMLQESEEHNKQFQTDHQLLIKTAKDLEELKKNEKADIENFKNNRIQDREQSFEIQKQLTNAIANVNSNLEVMRKESIDREISQLRWDILKFATDISNGKKAKREAYDFISKCYSRYEELLEATGQENGLVEESVAYIKDSYRQKLENGEF